MKVTVVQLTDIIMQLFCQRRVFVNQRKTLVHPLFNYMEMCVNLQIKKWLLAFVKE